MSTAVDGDVPRDLDEDASRSLALAWEEAVLLGHDRVGTEHLLLGLLANDGCSAAQALADAGATLAAARHKIAEAAGPSAVGGGGGGGGDTAASGRTARATRALNRSVRFSHARRSEVVTTDHVLLGVLDVEGTAGQVLRRLGVDVQRLREALDEAPSPEADAGVGATPLPTDSQETRRPPVATDRHPAPLICPSCGIALRGHVSLHELDVGAHTVSAVACSTCGVLLGLLPS